MLEEARKKGASVFVYLIFCLLIVIFVINFGPQGGQGGGCNSATGRIKIDGENASESSWLVAYGANSQSGKQKTYLALELLIRQELLAQEAEKRGLRVNEDLVMDEIKKGWFFLGGQRYQIPGIFTEDGFWNQNAFRGWYSGQLRLSRNSYVQAQQRGLLAALMNQLLQDSVQISRDEALAHFLFENHTVQYDVVAFRPEAYRAAMKLTDADVERFLATHQAEVEARYKVDERTYKGVKPQLQLRQIFIAAPAPPAAPAPAPAESAAGGDTAAAGSAADASAGSAADGSAAPVADKADDQAGSAAPVADKPAEAPKNPELEKQIAEAQKKVDEAKAKLEAVRTAAAKDKQKFIAAAKTLNSDEAMRNSAGDLGWRTADSAMLGDKAVTDAVKTLKPGEMTPVITTDRGVYLILAEAQREGDLTFDQVKHEIAKELARDVWSKEAAKRAAIAALDKARAGTGLNLDQLYEKQQPPANPGIDIQQILNDPNISPEQKQQILEMLMKSQGQQGSIVWESEDVPASWKAQADGAGGGSAAPAAPATDTAKPTAPAAKPADPAAKPAADAADKPATDSAAGSPPAAGSDAAPAADAPAPAEAAVAPSTDKLPEFGEVKKPTVSRFGPAPRQSNMEGIGTNKAAARALFEELSPGMLAKQVYEADGGFVVMQLIARSEPKVEDFEKDADRLTEELRAERARAFVEQWMKERCEALAKDEKIQPNPTLIRETDDDGNLLPTTGYRPCMSFQ